MTAHSVTLEFGAQPPTHLALGPTYLMADMAAVVLDGADTAAAAAAAVAPLLARAVLRSNTSADDLEEGSIRASPRVSTKGSTRLPEKPSRDLAERMLGPCAPQLTPRSLQRWKLRVRACLAVAALLPILGLVSDLTALNSFQANHQHFFSSILLLILYANWRFMTIYAAVTPRPSLVNILIVYMPFLVHFFWDTLMISEAAETAEAEALAAKKEAEAGGETQQQEPQQEKPLALQERVEETLQSTAKPTAPEATPDRVQEDEVTFIDTLLRTHAEGLPGTASETLASELKARLGELLQTREE